MNPTERILAALRTHGYEPRKSGDGWVCRCPAHDDSNPSLSIGTGDDGRVLLNCLANHGCAHKSIAAAVGLTEQDLFPERDGSTRGTRPRVSPSPKPRTKPKTRGSGDGDATTYPTAREAVAALEGRYGPKSAWWTYTDAAGEPVGLVVRWDRPPKEPGGAPSKEIQPVSKLSGGWANRGMPTPRPLYRLPELLATAAGSRVWVVEGEKAADAARAVGLVATTSPHGSKSAAKADWSPVAGRDVVILPDHDDPGERYAAEVARLCMAAGARSVRIVRLVELWADLPEGGDMADLLEHRGGDGNTIRAEVEAQAERAEADMATPETPAVQAFRPFPVDVLPEPIRSFVVEGAKAIGCDPSFIALPLLAALAAAIGNAYRLAMKRGWFAPPNLWVVTVGESGTHKSPAFRLAMKPIRKAQSRAFKEHNTAQADWEAECLRYEVELKAWQRTAGKSQPGDGYTIAPPEKPAPPTARRYTVADTTVEAIAPILLENPRGVMLARDELSGWLRSFDQYRGGRGADSAHWLSMHDGEEMTVDRKTGTPRTIHVPLASVSIAGGIQPGVLARAMGAEHHESGMLARLLFAMPPRKLKQWTEADVDPDTEAAAAAVFDWLLALTMEPDGDGGERPRLLAMTPEAKAVYVRFYNELALEQIDLSGDEAAAWSKLEGYAARLALVIHLTRWAGSDAKAPPGPVDEASVAAGVVLARWFGDEARRVYAILGESGEARESRRLVEWIERKGGMVTVRDVTHGVREYRGNTEAAERALSALVEAALGRWEWVQPGPKGGAPSKRFRLVSTVTVTETPADDPASGGSGDGDTGDAATGAGDGWGVI